MRNGSMITGVCAGRGEGGVRSPLELGLNWIACLGLGRRAAAFVKFAFIFMICELRFMMMLFVELLHFYGLS